MFDFWNTVKGNDLADVLIQELPRLATPKKQEMVESQNDEETRNAIRGISGERIFVLAHTVPLIGSGAVNLRKIGDAFMASLFLSAKRPPMSDGLQKREKNKLARIAKIIVLV